MNVSELTSEWASTTLRSLAERIVPLDECTECGPWESGYAGAEPGLRWHDMYSNRSRVLCKRCKERRPYARATEVRPEAFIEWLREAEEGVMFTVEDLESLLPKRGFEFL